MLLRSSFLNAAAAVAEIAGAIVTWRGLRVGFSPGEEATTAFWGRPGTRSRSTRTGTNQVISTAA
jgi:hypothetical protein